MIIKVFKRIGTEEELDTIDEFNIGGVDPLRVTPVHEKVGISLTVQQLMEMIAQVQPLEPLNLDEPDSYYAQNIQTWQDGQLSPDSIDIPHYIGLRIAVTNILQKYNAPDLLFQIG